MSELRKVCFAVNEVQYQKVKALPRSFNLSEKLRGALDKILDGTREECRRVFITNKDEYKKFYKLNQNGHEGKALIKLLPIEGTTQQIIIPAEEGYWIKLVLTDKDGKEIPDNTSLRPYIETISEGRPLDEYKYSELKRETGKLKRTIYIKPFEELVIYIEDVEKIQNIEFEFAMDLC